MKKVLSVLIILFVSFQLDAQWVQTNVPQGGSINSFATIGPNIFAGDIINGVFRSTDNGTNWTQENNGLNINFTWVYSLAVRGINLFAGGYGGVFLSSNNGKIWNKITNSPYNATSFAARGTNIIAGTSIGVWISTNTGINWKDLGQSPFDILSVAVRGDNIFIGTCCNGIYLSTNLGAVWAPIDDGLNIGTINSLAINGTNIFAGTDAGIFLSTNDGTNWTKVNNGLPDFTNVLSLLVIGNNVFAGTNLGGVYFSTDNGTSWADVSTGLTNSFIMSMVEIGTDLFVGTNGWGVWHRPLSEIITSVADIKRSKLPMSFELKQNYPNPFNPSTKINYTLPFNSKVTLEVYNITGERISQLVNEEQSAGYYSVDFNSSSINRSISSGVYFYRIIVSNKIDGTSFSSIKKMMILK